MNVGQVQGDSSMPGAFRQLIVNSIVSKNKLDAMTGKDPSLGGQEMQLVFREFAQMDPYTLGNMTAVGALGNFGRSFGNAGQSFGNFGRSVGSRFGFGGRSRSRKKRKTRRR